MRIKGTARGLAGLLVAAAITTTGLMLSTGAAYADNPRPALKAGMVATPVVAPGATGKVNYQLNNVSGRPTSGLLLNISLPRFVSLPADSRCKKTGSNPEGGDLISCNVQGPATFIAPGATLKGDNTFTVASNAPRHARLGRIGVLATPLNGVGQPAEDWNDTDGYNVSWSWISTP
jgi:hypothetical protein